MQPNTGIEISRRDFLRRGVVLMGAAATGAVLPKRALAHAAPSAVDAAPALDAGQAVSQAVRDAKESFAKGGLRQDRLAFLPNSFAEADPTNVALPSAHGHCGVIVVGVGLSRFSSAGHNLQTKTTAKSLTLESSSRRQRLA
jgi:hypothetical protein